MQPSPEIRAKAAELTKGASDDDAKLRAIYAYVSTQFRYIGIAFGIGRYQPHSAAAVLDNQYGDCKDKHTLLASLLQAAGISAYPALISSSYKLDMDVPSPAQFDHLITVVPRGKDVLWLDTTTEIGPFGYLVTTLRDKPALVMLREKPALFMTTPADPPFPSSITFTAQGKLSDAGVLDAKMEEEARGNTEVVLRMAFRRVPQAQWKDLVQNLSYGAGFGGTVSEIVASSPEVTGSPFRFSYSYNRKDYSDWENRRISPPFPALLLPTLKDNQTKFSQPLWWGEPGEVIYAAEIEMPKGYSPELPPAVDIVRDFGEYHASYTLDHGMLTARRHLVGKLKEVPISEFEQYKSFRKGVENDLNRWIVLDSGANITASAAFSTRTTIEDLPDSSSSEAMRLESAATNAAKPLQQSDAIAALRSAVRADPKFTRAWLRLATLYISMNKTESGLAAFRKAVELDSSQPLPHRMLANALQWNQRPEEAVRVWKDLLKVAPQDAEATASLGSILYNLNHYDEAASTLELAIKLNPQRPNLPMQLGSAYLKAGHVEKGFRVYEKILELDSRPAILNTVADALADANQKLPEALQYAERAVHEEEERSQDVRLSEVQGADLQPTANLARYWSTLGWVWFRQGKLNEAEDYLAAAWNLSQNWSAADHLGKVYEQNGKKDAAIRMYRLALAANTNASETKARLNRLTAGDSKRSLPLSQHDLDELLTTKITLPATTELTGIETILAEFLLLIAPGPRVEGAKFISGSEKLKFAEKVLTGSKFPIIFPADSKARLLRRGVLRCEPGIGCSFALYVPSLVFSVD